MVKHAAQWPKRKASHDEAMVAAYTCGLIGLNQLSHDQKTIAERKWNSGLKPTAPQKPCDLGLFSDDKDQTEMPL